MQIIKHDFGKKLYSFINNKTFIAMQKKNGIKETPK